MLFDSVLMRKPKSSFLLQLNFFLIIRHPCDSTRNPSIGISKWFGINDVVGFSLRIGAYFDLGGMIRGKK